jgi:hypothetical protein
MVLYTHPEIFEKIFLEKVQHRYILRVLFLIFEAYLGKFDFKMSSFTYSTYCPFKKLQEYITILGRQ